MAEDEKLKRERAGTYVTADGRFTVEQSTTGWLVLDSEQTNELGLPLARGPFGTLDEARAAIADARTGPRPISDLDEHRRSKQAASAGPARARTPRAEGRADAPGGPRRAAKRATGQELVLREIRASDGDELRRLWTSVGFGSQGDDDRSLARMTRRNPGLLLVATVGGRIVGSALGGFDGRRGWLYHVATADDHRRQGVATKLVERIEASLADLGCPKVSVSVGEGRDAARAFWKARGYDLNPSRQFRKELEAG